MFDFDLLYFITWLASILLMFPAAVLSLVWAPVGGGITWALAHSRGLSGFRYGLIGALYSAALFWPWLYFTASVNRKWVEPGFVRAV